MARKLHHTCGIEEAGGKTPKKGRGRTAASHGTCVGDFVAARKNEGLKIDATLGDVDYAHIGNLSSAGHVKQLRGTERGRGGVAVSAETGWLEKCEGTSR
jgi:hypothetical protein